MICHPVCAGRARRIAEKLWGTGGTSFEIDVQATFGLNDEDAEDVRLLGFFDFGLYYRLRELEDKSHAEAMRIIDDALDEIEAEK